MIWIPSWLPLARKATAVLEGFKEKIHLLENNEEKRRNIRTEYPGLRVCAKRAQETKGPGFNPQSKNKNKELKQPILPEPQASCIKQARVCVRVCAERCLSYSYDDLEVRVIFPHYHQLHELKIDHFFRRHRYVQSK